MSDFVQPRYPLLHVDATPEQVDELVGRLTLLGAEGIEERDATTLAKGGALGVTLIASFPTHEAAAAAAAELGGRARIEEIVGDAWRDAWKEHWRPTRLGESLVIVPSWVEYAPAPGDVVIQLDPGRAFGTGQHASTALAAAALERRIRAGERDVVIDVGCGSGVLTFAALLLGTARAIACDTDPEAVAAARENAMALGLLERLDLRAGGPEVLPESSRLVVANIEAAVLIPMAASVAARVAPGGALILSGILASQCDAVVAAYETQGLVLERCEEREGWVAPELLRRA